MARPRNSLIDNYLSSGLAVARPYNGLITPITPITLITLINPSHYRHFH